MRLTAALLPLVASVLTSSVVASEADGPQQSNEQHSSDLREDLGSMPIDTYLEVHQVITTVEQITSKPSPRHEAEKKALLGRIDRAHGKWDKHHNRHRLLDALHGYLRHSQTQGADLDKWRRYYKNTSSAQKKILEREVRYTSKLDSVGKLIEANQVLCDQIVDAALAFYEVSREELDKHVEAVEKEGKTAEKVSVSQTMKHFVRDWSAQGLSERDAAFPCVLAALQGLFPDRSKGDVKVLLPGAGVGRLGQDVAALGGFEVTNNEWSMYMNLAYRYLEAHPRPESSSAHPFIDNWSHHATTADMFREVAFPDRPVNSSAVLLVEGDFTKVFSDNKNHYDVLVTHFFIDTARNLMAYFDTIHSLIKKGGYWVNFGPLLYGSGPYVQLSLDEVVKVVQAYGFEFVEAPEECGALTNEEGMIRGREAAYGFNERALTKHAYHAQAWVMRKK